MQQQLAVERQLVRASAREKADVDASLEELTRQASPFGGGPVRARVNVCGPSDVGATDMR